MHIQNNLTNQEWVEMPPEPEIQRFTPFLMHRGEESPSNESEFIQRSALDNSLTKQYFQPLKLEL